MFFIQLCKCLFNYSNLDRKNYFFNPKQRKNGEKDYNYGACKGLMKIYSNYLRFDHLKWLKKN